MKIERKKYARQSRRRQRVRKHVNGTPERPRLAVFRSLRNISAQIIDDLSGRTLCQVSTLSKDLRSTCEVGGNCSAAAIVGKTLAEKAKELGIEQLCFDRGGRKFHGRIKALADAAREAGLKF